MDDGFWIFLILQLIALGPCRDQLKLGGPSTRALLAGTLLSLLSAFFLLMIGHGGVQDDTGRRVIKWLIILSLTGSLAATGASMLLRGYPPKSAQEPPPAAK